MDLTTNMVQENEGEEIGGDLSSLPFFGFNNEQKQIAAQIITLLNGQNVSDATQLLRKISKVISERGVIK